MYRKIFSACICAYCVYIDCQSDNSNIFKNIRTFILILDIPNQKILLSTRFFNFTMNRKINFEDQFSHKEQNLYLAEFLQTAEKDLVPCDFIIHRFYCILYSIAYMSQ